MNKTECLALLDKIETEISNHTWEAQVEENLSTLDHKDLRPYMEDFDLPETEIDGTLPMGWMDAVDPESESYSEVVEKYQEVYRFLLIEASRESEALDAMDDQDDRDQLSQYWSDVG